MKIAFASCMCTRVFKDQPVWDWIAAQSPDHLVLLGDSVYLDINTGSIHPQDMGEDQFAQHAFALYTELLAQPSFRKLVTAMPQGRTWSIWDDHDFLWNDAIGSQASQSPLQRAKVRLSTAFQETFRNAIAKSLSPGSFPAIYNDGAFWNEDQPALTTPSVELAPDVWLHLSDGRTHRTGGFGIPESKKTILGQAQRAQFDARISGSHAKSIHLFASGQTLGEYKQRYPTDWNWFTDVAKKWRMLVLSGDIHRNESDAFFTRGLPLHEVTSSGAAVRDAVILGKARRNFGIVEIDDGGVNFKVFANNKVETKHIRTLSRDTWLPV